MDSRSSQEHATLEYRFPLFSLVETNLPNLITTKSSFYKVSGAYDHTHSHLQVDYFAGASEAKVKSYIEKYI